MNISAKSILIIVLVMLLSVHYLGLQAHSVRIPTYLDTVYSFGAGAKLAYTGHFSDTFMLHGLLNPFLVELIIKAGAADGSFIIARQAQSIWAAITLLGIYGSLRSLFGSRLSKMVCALSATTIFLSSMATIELLDIRPECPSMAGVSLLLWVCISKRTGATPILTGLVSAFLIAARPTNFLLLVPAAAVAVSDRITGLIGNKRFWADLLLSVVTCFVTLVLISPGYLIHAGSLARQFDLFYWTRDPRTHDARVICFNITLTVGYLWLAIPGAFHAAGLSIFSASLLRRHHDRARLLAFIIGILPFVASICLNANYQPRYLLPIVPLLMVCSTAGYMELFSRSRSVFIAVAAVTGLMAGYQGMEIWLKKMTGGLADLLQIASTMQVSSFSGCTESFHGATYGSDGDPSWPLMPFVSGASSADRGGAQSLLISDVSTLEGYDLIDSSDVSPSFCDEVRRSPSPGLMGLLVLIREPWTWRSWGPLYLLERNDHAT